MKNFHQEPYELGVLKAKCVTARKLNDADFRTAAEHVRYNAALRRHKLPRGFPENLGITADDLWRDQAIIRYVPEFMVWLGHTPAQWAAVKISDEQKSRRPCTRTNIWFEAARCFIFFNFFLGGLRRFGCARGEMFPRKIVRQVIGDLSISGVKGLVKKG